MSGEDLSRVLTAGGTVAVALLVVFLVERAFRQRGRRLAERVTGGEGLDPTLETRLRFVRRLIEAVIVVIGVATALSQFTALGQFAASVLASGAIAAAVIGFAAQQSLGNVLAGVLLAVTQPIRIGDQISFDEHRGVVEDIRLTHTFLQTGTDTRIIVPNGRLAQAVVRNDSIVTSTVGVDIELWLDTGSDELRAIDVLQAAIPEARATITAVTHEGTTLAVTGPATTPVERDLRRSELLRSCLRALREAGLR